MAWKEYPLLKAYFASSSSLTHEFSSTYSLYYA